MAQGLCDASFLPRSIYSVQEKESCNTWLLRNYAPKRYIYILGVLFLKSQVLQLLKIYIINILTKYIYLKNKYILLIYIYEYIFFETIDQRQTDHIL